MLEYEPRVKAAASIDSNGDIVLGDALPGFALPYAAGNALYTYKYLLEDTVSGVWEMGDYRPNHAFPSQRRVPKYGPGFSPVTGGLTMSIVASPSAYVASLNVMNGDYAPVVRSVGSVAAGCGSLVGENCPNSTALGDGAQCTSLSGVAVGQEASARHDRCVVVGKGAMSGDYFQAPGSTAIGCASRSIASGGVALGNYHVPHLQTMPIRATAVVDFEAVDSVADGGTFEFWCVADGDGSAAQAIFEIYSYAPDSLYSYTGVTRVQGTVVATATSPADSKTFDVDFAFKGTTLLYSTFTALHTGANTPAISLSLGVDNKLLVTAPAIAGLKVGGLLLVSCIALS